jgi:hypothetical protein
MDDYHRRLFCNDAGWPLISVCHRCRARSVLQDRNEDVAPRFHGAMEREGCPGAFVRFGGKAQPS